MNVAHKSTVARGPGSALRAEMLRQAAALHQSGRLDAAEQIYKQLVAAGPDANALHLLGVLRCQQHQHATAVELIRKALALCPSSAMMHNNLASALNALGHLDEALRHFQRAVSLEPDYADAHFNLGDLYYRLRRAEEAAAHYRRVLALQPQDAGALEKMGNVLALEGQMVEAAACYTKAFSVRPTPGLTVKTALMLPPIPASAEQLGHSRLRFEANLERLRAQHLQLPDPAEENANASFYLAYHNRNDRQVRQALARFYLEACPSLAFTAPHCHAPGQTGKRRLRVGFISRFLKNHTIGRLMQGIIERLARDRFEAIVFQLGDGDGVTESIARAASRFVPLTGRLAELREQIAAQRLDIAFYPDIGMEPYSYFLAFARLAPVQCVTWGHPVTTGIPALDYFVSSELIEPPAAEAHYSERLVKLQSLPVCYAKPELPSELPGRSQFGFPSEWTLYACPQSLFKFHPDFDAAIGAILRQDPRGRLVLVEGEIRNWSRLLRERLSLANPDVADRVVVLPRLSRIAFCNLLNAADAVLDTPWFGGGNSTLEALAVGAPVVTLPGPFMRGRIVAACYRKMGLGETIARACVAADLTDYAEKAVRVAQNPTWRAQVRQEILARNQVLYDDTGAVEELESFFERAVAETCQEGIP